MALTSCVCFKKQVQETDFINEYPEKYSIQSNNSDLQKLVKGYTRAKNNSLLKNDDSSNIFIQPDGVIRVDENHRAPRFEVPDFCNKSVNGLSPIKTKISLISDQTTCDEKVPFIDEKLLDSKINSSSNNRKVHT